MSGKWISAISGILVSVGCANGALAQMPVAPPPPVILPPVPGSGYRQEPQPVHSVRLILIQNGQTIMNQPLRIGGRGNSTISITEPAGTDLPSCPGFTNWQSNQRQINVTITPVRNNSIKNLYSINIRYSRPEGAGECFNNAERSVNLQQTFEWIASLMSSG
jgi:hypothetical protein